MNPLTTSVFRWYGDSRFYKTPGLKSVLVGVSACSLLYRLLAARATPRVSPLCPLDSRWGLLVDGTSDWLLWSVQMWACPSAGVWLVAVLILISCRPLERQLGAAKFARQWFSSVVGGVALSTAVYAGASHHDNTLSLPIGAVLHVMVGSVAWLYHSSVHPLHLLYPLPFLPISTNTILYLLTALFGCSSTFAAMLTLCGVMGACVQSALGPLPLPSPPSWITACTSCILDTEGQPPAPLSGATLVIQRQQHMDQLEHMMATLHHNRQRFALHTYLRRRLPPSQDQINQLVVMGFTQTQAQQALVATDNDIAAAIHLLTSRNHPPNS